MRTSGGRKCGDGKDKRNSMMLPISRKEKESLSAGFVGSEDSDRNSTRRNGNETRRTVPLEDHGKKSEQGGDQEEGCWGV